MKLTKNMYDNNSISTGRITTSGTLSQKAIDMLLHGQNVKEKYILTHPQRFKDLRVFGLPFFRESSRRSILGLGEYGYYRDFTIKVSTEVPKNVIYLVPFK